jgi:hypothetical protein
MNTNAYDHDKFLTIAECLSISGYANAYFRMKVLKLGKIEHHTEMIPGSSIPRVLVNKASFEKYLVEHPRGADTKALKSEIEELKAQLKALRGE